MLQSSRGHATGKHMMVQMNLANVTFIYLLMYLFYSIKIFREGVPSAVAGFQRALRLYTK